VNRICKECDNPVEKWRQLCAACRAKRRPPPANSPATCSQCGRGYSRHCNSKTSLCCNCTHDAQYEAYKPIRRASAKIQQAIKSGKLLRPIFYHCADCGRQASEYDHRDYSKPLEVEPVCHPCNLRRGPGLKQQAAT
jgi:hypothetical protein